jgi:hypothetical protein
MEAMRSSETPVNMRATLYIPGDGNIQMFLYRSRCWFSNPEGGGNTSVNMRATLYIPADGNLQISLSAQTPDRPRCSPGFPYSGRGEVAIIHLHSPIHLR